MNWPRLTTMGMSTPTPTSASGYSITRPARSMSALRSSRHRNSSIFWNFQRTPFCFPSNFLHLALPALLPAVNHVISILAIPARSSSD